MDCYEALEMQLEDYGAPELMIYNGAQEQVGPGTKFQFNFRKYGIHGHVSEMECSNQNPAEGVIQELCKRWCQENFRTYCPRQLWSYGYPYITKIMQLADMHTRTLQGRTSVELMTGETPHISECLDFGCYDRVWFKEEKGLGENQIGRFLGKLHKVGSLMSY